MCQPSLTPDGNTALTHQDLARGILAKNSNALASQPYIWVPTWHSQCPPHGLRDSYPDPSLPEDLREGRTSLRTSQRCLKMESSLTGLKSDLVPPWKTLDWSQGANYCHLCWLGVNCV